MKKSKIIVPAVALLALGMAASVTGTVAWFTQNNSVRASQMIASVANAQDIRISVAGQNSWKTSLESPTDAWIVNTSNNGGLAAAIEGTDADFKTSKVYNAGAATSGVATTGIQFIQPEAANEINPASGAAATQIAVDNSANKGAGKYEASTNYVYGQYDLLYGGADATKTVPMVIHVGATSSADIDAALTIAVIQDEKIYTRQLGTWNDSTKYSDVAGPDITLSNGVAKNVKVYIWYDGTHANAKNSNAKLNQLTFEVSYTLPVGA